MKQLLKRWVLAFLVPRPLIGILYLPRYFSHWRRYSALAKSAQLPQPLLSLVVASALSVDTALKQDSRGLG